MRVMKKNIQAAIIAAVGLFVFSCTRESVPTVRESNSTTVIRLTGIGNSSKSVLSDDIEDRVNGIKLAVYDESGALEVSAYVSSGASEGIEISMNSTSTHNVYALINMGNVSVPLDEDEMEALEYYIESYTSIEEMGMPMAGLYKNLGKGATNCEIPVSRLMARISLSMTEGEIEPDQITSVALYNCNCRLTPFAEEGSKALEETDVIGGEEGMFETLDGWDGTELCFYVPENMQGTLLAGNDDPTLKTPSSLAANGYEGMEELCTYIETTVWIDPESSTTGVSGSLSYRFFLGKDNVTNFDVEGNCAYTLSFSLSWDGQFLEDEWMVDNDYISDTRVLSVEVPYLDDDSYNVGGRGELKSGWEAAAFVSLTAAGKDITSSSYGQIGGWCVSEASAERLTYEGIGYEFVKATPVYDTLEGRLRYLRSGEDMPEGCVSVDEEERNCLILGMENFLYHTDTLTVVIQTSEGEKKATACFDMSPYINIEAVLDGDEEGDLHYIAQRNLLSISGIPDRVESYDVYTLSETEEIISLTDKGDDSDCYYVDFMGAGSDQIMFGCSYVNDDGSEDSYSQYLTEVNVRAPHLKFSADSLLIIKVNGASAIYLGYYDDSENLMDSIGDDEEEYSYEYSTCFYQDNFDSLLKPILKLSYVGTYSDYLTLTTSITGAVTTISATISGSTVYDTDSPGACLTAYPPVGDIDPVSIDVWAVKAVLNDSGGQLE